MPPRIWSSRFWVSLKRIFLAVHRSCPDHPWLRVPQCFAYTLSWMQLLAQLQASSFLQEVLWPSQAFCLCRWRSSHWFRPFVSGTTRSRQCRSFLHFRRVGNWQAFHCSTLWADLVGCSSGRLASPSTHSTFLRTIERHPSLFSRFPRAAQGSFQEGGCPGVG